MGYSLIQNVLLTIILAANLIQISLFLTGADYVTQRAVYDMDTIRAQYEASLRRYITRACLDGTDYPPEWRQSPTGFNSHSPSMYCSDLSAQRMDADIVKDVITLGRKTYDGN